MKPITERVRNVRIDPLYEARCADFDEIYELAKTDMCGAFITCFKFGYMKGQRAAAAKAKRKALCTTAIVQSAKAKTEPKEAHAYLTAIDPKSQMFRDPERIVNLYKTQIAASGEEISENALRLIEAAAQLAHHAYRRGFADGQKGGDLHAE